MPPFRNPFGRKPQGVVGVVDENRPPSLMVSGPYGEKSRPSTISIRSQTSEPEEMELGTVDDNGTYQPPSPPERRSMWRRTPTSTTTSSHCSVISDNDGFSISRESFESYRRSFDISARSPVIHPESTYSRQSLDSIRTPYTPSSLRQNSGKSFESRQSTEVNTVDEEDQDVFEDVGLDESNKTQKKGIFSRFIKDENASSDASQRPTSGHRGFHLGRKRGQSGQGSELGDWPRPASGKELQEEVSESQPRSIAV